MTENKKLTKFELKDKLKEFSEEELVKFIIDLALLNIDECKQTLYKIFFELKSKNILYKNEDVWVKKLMQSYEKNFTFPDKAVLMEFEYSPLDNVTFNNLKMECSKNPNSLNEILNVMLEKRKHNVFIEKNKKDLEEACKTSNLPIDLLYRIQDFQNEQYSILERTKKRYTEFKLNFGIPYLDNRYNTLPAGSIINVIKNKNADNYFEVSVIYNTLANEGKNICVITPTWTKYDIVFKLLTLHSQTLEEEKKLDYKKILEGTEDFEKIQLIYNDFLEKFNNHLQIFCNSSLEIFNIETFGKLIKESNSLFSQTTGSPLEMLVIDRVENFRFEKNGVIEDNSSKILKEYCSLLIREVKMFSRSNTNPLTVLISTNVCSKSTQRDVFVYDLYEDYTKDFESGSNLLEKYSDMVIIVANQRKSTNTLDNYGVLQVLKSQNMIPMIEPVQIITSICTCKVKKMKEFFEEENIVLDGSLQLNLFPEFATSNKSFPISKKQ